MVKRERWREAQSYERQHWVRAIRTLQAEGSTLDWYDWKARCLVEKIEPYLDVATAQILEIGSGPVGIVSGIKSGQKFAIDPLEDFFKVRPELTDSRAKDTHYLKGMGETLPFKDRIFDVVIIDNVIDHCQEPEGVLSEISRVLKPEGLLYFTVNVHTALGCFVRALAEFFELDKGHPYTYSVKKARDLLRRGEFDILAEEIQDYRAAKKKSILSKNSKRILKGLIGAAEFEYKALCRSGIR